MSLPDQMSMTSRTDPRPEPLPRSLLVMLSMLVALGLASTAASVIAARSDGAANQRVLERLEQQEQETSVDVTEHRERNEILHAVICEQNQTIADRFNIPLPQCPPPNAED